MDNKLRYEFMRITTGWFLLASGFIFSDLYFMIGALICLLFSCDYEEDEDIFPEMTHHCQNRMFNKQIFGLCFILLAIILHRYENLHPSHITLLVGLYYSTYHPNLYFYRKDAVVVSGVYTQEEIDKMDKGA